MSIITEYLQYVENTEPPVIFHRWSFLTAIGALLQRNVWYGNGYFTYYPNLYVMLMGESGTKKNTAINLARKLLESTGYNYFSAEKTSKEKYLQDLAELHEDLEDDITTATLFGANSEALNGRISPSFICAGEFNDFIGNGNIEFMSILGNLWDWNGVPYTNRIKTGKSISIPQPTISILAGNTATGFSLAFPSSAIGQGFFSRLLLIHSTPTGRRIRNPTFPPSNLGTTLLELSAKLHGNLGATPIADKMLDAIYNEFIPLDDARFTSYSSRRYPQLIKLCIIVAACRFSNVIEEQDVLFANTILSHAECLMPRALGEFGKAKNSDVAHTVIGMIRNNSPNVTTLQEIWESVSQDMETMSQLMDIIRKLLEAKRIQMVRIPGSPGGFLPVRKALDEESKYVDFTLLTQEEREMKL